MSIPPEIQQIKENFKILEEQLKRFTDVTEPAIAQFTAKLTLDYCKLVAVGLDQLEETLLLKDRK